MFFPLFLASYFLAPKALKNLIIVIFSLIFYAWGEPVYIVLMLFSTLVDYIHGQIVEKNRGTKKAKYALVSSILINLGLLIIFKYTGFIVSSINSCFSLSIPVPDIPLPIGISFYTFQTMSYTIDVYRGQSKIQKNIIDFCAYVSMFPQLIAGPIVRYSDIAIELNDRKHTVNDFAEGAKRFTVGLSKKVLLANSIGAVWTEISSFGAERQSVFGAWLGIIAFAFQIYFDFSGYSDMAIGLGRMMGFHFCDNFNYPYISKSITEFWRRWHISLGTWFREYLYIPLGGNRCGIKRQLFNIFVVWAATGIWHGASLNYLFWGLYYCLLLVLEKTFLLKYLKKAPSFVSHAYTLICVLFGWVLFAFEDFGALMDFLRLMLGLSGAPFINQSSVYMLSSNALMLIIMAVASTPLVKNLYQKLLEKREMAAYLASNFTMICGFVVSCAYLVNSTYNPFLYFRF